LGISREAPKDVLTLQTEHFPQVNQQIMRILLALLLTIGSYSLSLAQTETNVTATPDAKHKQTKAEKKKGGAVIWDKLEHDFGTIKQDVPAKAVFKLKNKTKLPLLLTTVQASCGCTATGYSKEPIKPGKSTEISATYNAHVKGPFTKTISVMTNLSTEQVILRIRGTVE
jgi:hypothetical protein